MERTGAAPRSTERVSPRAVRDIARLRAKRAARLASEAAASKRRMAASAVFALATVLLGVGVWAADLAWVWTAIPGAALVASLGASRFAAARGRAGGRTAARAARGRPPRLVPLRRGRGSVQWLRFRALPAQGVVQCGGSGRLRQRRKARVLRSGSSQGRRPARLRG